MFEELVSSNLKYALGKRAVFYHGEEERHNTIIAEAVQGNLGQGQEQCGSG